MNPDWSSLPPELLEKIMLEKLGANPVDYIRFRAVCKNWRSVTSIRLPPQTPWLMLPTCEHDTPYDDAFYGGDFFSLSENKVFHIDLPEAIGKRCFGSSHGWLCLVDHNTVGISLLNPLTKVHIQLPPINIDLQIPISEGYAWSNLSVNDEDMDQFYITESRPVELFHKFMLSKNPTLGEDYIVMIIFSERQQMIFCRPGDVKWWCVIPDRKNLVDGIYYKGKFYGIEYEGNITICDFDAFNPDCKTIAPKEFLSVDYLGCKRYLVEVFGELMMVIQCVLSNDDYFRIHKMKWFEVYKFRLESDDWVKVMNLNDCALFVGMNSSFSLSTKDGHSKGYKANHIYFTDDIGCIHDFVGGHDVGIFNLEDGSIEPLPCYVTDKLWMWPPPMWLTPSPH